MTDAQYLELKDHIVKLEARLWLVAGLAGLNLTPWF